MKDAVQIDQAHTEARAALQVGSVVFMPARLCDLERKHRSMFMDYSIIGDMHYALPGQVVLSVARFSGQLMKRRMQTFVDYQWVKDYAARRGLPIQTMRVMGWG